MKKIILALTAIATISGAYAQKNKVVSAYNYNKAFTRSQKCSELAKGVNEINAATGHDVTKNWAKTWYYRGNIFYNILATKDQACKAIDPDALNKCTDSYFKALVLNFKDPELKKLDLEKEDGSDLVKFNEAVQNKAKTDDEMYTRDIMGRKFPGLAIEYANKGINEFTAKDYTAAQKSFGKSMFLSRIGGRLDTTVMYNTALAAEYGKDYETAKKIYNGLINMGYNVDGNGPNLYTSMSKIYKSEGNEEKSIEYIRKGREAYPENNNLLVIELDYYLQSGKHEEALNNLNKAIEKDGSNATYFFARGSVYDNLKEVDKAVADYKKAIEIKPDYFDPNYNLGAYYYNAAADKINVANELDISKTKEYNKLKEEAKADFTTAVPYIEVANKTMPEDIDTANMLIKLYTQTGDYEKAKELKAKYQ